MKILNGRNLRRLGFRKKRAGYIHKKIARLKVAINLNTKTGFVFLNQEIARIESIPDLMDLLSDKGINLTLKKHGTTQD